MRNGERQRADGRYPFVYTDWFGKHKFLYSWKLESTDPFPAGRRPCQSLREQEKEIVNAADKKDSEKWAFNWKRIGIASMFAVTVVGIGAAALGGNFNVKLPKKSWGKGYYNG